MPAVMHNKKIPIHSLRVSQQIDKTWHQIILSHITLTSQCDTKSCISGEDKNHKMFFLPIGTAQNALKRCGHASKRQQCFFVAFNSFTW